MFQGSNWQGLGVVLQQVQLKGAQRVADGTDGVQARLALQVSLSDEQATQLQYVGGAVAALLASSKEQDADEGGANTMAIAVKRPFGAYNVTLGMDGREAVTMYGLSPANRPKVMVVEGVASIAIKLDGVLRTDVLADLAAMVDVEGDVTVTFAPQQQELPLKAVA